MNNYLLQKSAIGDGVKYLKENMNVQILMHEGRIIGIDLPNFVELEVVDTPPAEKGKHSPRRFKTCNS